MKNCQLYCIDYKTPSYCPYYLHEHNANIAYKISSSYPITCKNAVLLLEMINTYGLEFMNTFKDKYRIENI